FGVDQRQQLPGGRRVALLDGVQDLGNVTHRHPRITPRSRRNLISQPPWWIAESGMSAGFWSGLRPGAPGPAVPGTIWWHSRAFFIVSPWGDWAGRCAKADGTAGPRAHPP